MADSFPMKAVINKNKTRVLFAEIDYQFTEYLLHISTLSLGLVMRALLENFEDETRVIGSLNNLYRSLEKLYNYNVDGRFRLKKNTFDKLFGDFHSRNMEVCCNASVCKCPTFFKISSPYSSFIIGEDLRVVALRKGSIVESLNNVGVAVADMDGAETRDVTIGGDGIMDFLVRLLISRHPLTDIILGTSVNSELAEVKPEAGIPLQCLEKDATSNGKMMILKLTLLKSTNKLLFAQADQDFVNYLFSVLLIPLGRVNYHLGSNTCPINVDTLFTSVTNLLRVPDLVRETVYVCNYLHCIDTMATKFPLETFFDDEMFMITDDLSVTRYTFVSGLLFLDEMKISLSDVKEVELQIGIDEVYSILKASLTSTRALTDGLINSKSKKTADAKA